MGQEPAFSVTFQQGGVGHATPTYRVESRWAPDQVRCDEVKGLGEEVVITRRGKPVARLVQFRESDEGARESVAEELRNFWKRRQAVTLADLLEDRHRKHRY